jgi:hypothetical protein
MIKSAGNHSFQSIWSGMPNPGFLARLFIYLLAAACLAPDRVAAQPPGPDARFGIVESYVNSAAATEARAGYTRIILRWDVIQPGGPVDWKPANVPDPFVQAELAAGRQVVGLLIGTPAWAAVDPSQGARAVPKMDAWAAFVRRMAQQYHGRIDHWIIWNEPDVWERDHPGNTWAGNEQDYYLLQKTAYVAIKDVDRSLKVHLAGLTYFWDWSHGRRQYLDRFLDVVAADPDAPAHDYYFDAVTYHLYFKPLQALQVIGEARQSLDRHGMTGKAIWINETNAPASDDAQELPWSSPRFQISLDEQAAFMLQEMALAFAAGAERVEVYKLRNTADHPESIEPFGLLRADDSRRPAFAAFRTAATYLRDFHSAYLERQGDLYAVTFDRGPQTTTVIWTTGRNSLEARLHAIAPEAVVVDVVGRARPVAATAGQYVLALPGAACTAGIDCFIGGAPLLLVEAAPAAGRRALSGPAAALSAVLAQTNAQDAADPPPLQARNPGPPIRRPPMAGSQP